MLSKLNKFINIKVQHRITGKYNMHQTDDGRRTKEKTKAHMAKGTTIIYKTRYRNINIEEHEPQ